MSDLFTKKTCTTCGYFCHKYKSNDTGLLVNSKKKDELCKLLQNHEKLKIHPYKIEIVAQKSFTSKEKYDNKIRHPGFFRDIKKENQTCAIRYESYMGKTTSSKKR
jgi:hypothetical protein